MDIIEFNNVKNLSYRLYCDYLQSKYGIGLDDYMTPNWHMKKTYSRTSDGLVAHHMDEDKYLNLSDWPQRAPYECQKKENLVYCDLLEHLLLHVKICQFPNPDRVDQAAGEPGILAYLVPELNDLYSGWKTKQQWRQRLHQRIENDKEVYLRIVKIYVDYLKESKVSTHPSPQVRSTHYRNMFHSSLNEIHGSKSWNKSNNKELFKQLDSMWDD